MRYRALLLPLAALTLAGCVQARYVTQAGLGQLELWGLARPVDEVLADPDTGARTRALLREARRVVAYGERNGLDPQGNYTRYVDLDREAVVWFMTTSRPLAFEEKTWSFPIVGSFPYLGWFDYFEAREMRRRLEEEGWDVYVRPVSAYSTGGWFRDPILSTMLSSEEGALRRLANVLLHELTHANVIIYDQSTFNESLASFVGDRMAEEYLAERFGEGSAQVAAFRAELEEQRRRGERLARAYEELDALYRSDATDREKRARKAELLRELEAELGLSSTPNNASLIGFRTYNAGLEELGRLYETCGRSWPRFLGAVASLDEDSFSEEQQEKIGPVIEGLIDRGCPGD